MEKTEQAAKLLRYYSLLLTSRAGSGHPTSCLSAADLMAVLFTGGFFRYDISNPRGINNDRLIFSKGHASALFYSLWKVAGGISEKELLTYREFGSSLEGHPTPDFKFVDAATGSLGQGLSIGCGFALNAKLENLEYKTFVLLGDSEMAEGSNWEAMGFASFYKLNNLIGIIDVNRLGQRGETMLGWDTKKYEERASSFGWETIVIDGHDFGEISKAYSKADYIKKPLMIIAKTIKGKGVSFLENQEGRHGKVLKEDELKKALKEIGQVSENLIIDLPKPPSFSLIKQKTNIEQAKISYKKGDRVATRQAYGSALVRIFPNFPNLIALDGEVSDSTRSYLFKEQYPQNFIECFIAEQNMVGVALGLSKMGKIPFVSTFSTFFTRAFDQIRMASYSNANIKFVGSHGGVSVGEDGPSQMGLEDISLFRSVFGSVVLYPSDAVSCDQLVEEAAKHKGIVYIRTTRMDMPVIYDSLEKFLIGGSKVLRESKDDQVTIIAVGITLHEALKAYDELLKQGIKVRIIDLYSIKPIDERTLKKAANETKLILTVEDHYEAGGIGEAVKSCLSDNKIQTYSLFVSKKPKSGKPEELLDYEEISAKNIVKEVLKVQLLVSSL